MALYEIEYKHVEVYYASDTIEADSQEAAEEIAKKLLDSGSFDEHLFDNLNYDDHEDSFIQAYEVERGNGKFQRHPTLSAQDIKDFLED